MACSRWTVLFTPHDGARTRSLPVSGTALRVACTIVAVLAVALLAGTAVVVTQSVGLSREWRLESANRALTDQVAHLGRRVVVLSKRLAAMSRADDEARLVAGLDPLSPAVKEAGIGGPPEPWPDRDRLLAEAGGAGRVAFSVHESLDDVMRRANIIAASLHQAADSLTAHFERIEATPSIMPTAGPITSGFSLDRYDPILHVDQPHEGIDIGAPYGARILASAAGRVVKVGWDAGYGLMVEIDHGYGIETRYAHMSRTVAMPGQEVQRGDLLGFVGSTGFSTGPHLHYEVRVNGRAVNPQQFVLPDDYGD